MKRQQKNRFSISYYKEGGSKSDWISHKIGVIMNEHPDMKQDQAVAIAYSMYEKRNHMEEGGEHLPMYQNGVQTPTTFNPNVTLDKMLAEQNPQAYPAPSFNKHADPYLPTMEDLGATTQGLSPQEHAQTLKGAMGTQYGENLRFNTEQGTIGQASPNKVTQQQQDNTPQFGSQDPYQFYNPYGGGDLTLKAASLGDSIAGGDPLEIAANSISFLGNLGRVGIGAYAGGKRKEEAKKAYFENKLDKVKGDFQPLYDEQRWNGSEGYSYQDGGTMPNFLQEGGFNIETDLNGYNLNVNPIVAGDLNNVERVQKFVPNTGYGSQVQDVNKTINTHDWYFNTDAKKENFRKALGNKGKSQEVLDFQNAYNDELKRRLANSKLTEEQRAKIYNESAFTGKGVQSVDGKFGAFTSSRPMFANEVNTTANPPQNTSTPQEMEKVLKREPLYRVKLHAEDMSDNERDFTKGSANLFIQDRMEKQGGLTQKEIDILQKEMIDKHNQDIEAKYNNPEAQKNKKAQERYQKLKQSLVVEEVPQYQQGGEMPVENQEAPQEMQQDPQEQQEQMMQQVASALQGGADPQEVLKQLVQMGIPQDQATQLIQGIMQQMQGVAQNPQEEQAEGTKSNPQEDRQEQSMMENGGYYINQMVGKKIKGYTFNNKTGNYDVEFE